MGPRLGRVEYWLAQPHPQKPPQSFNGATLRTRGIQFMRPDARRICIRFNGATLRTRGIRIVTFKSPLVELASMGPRLGRVEYIDPYIYEVCDRTASMGPRLGRVEYAK